MIEGPFVRNNISPVAYSDGDPSEPYSYEMGYAFTPIVINEILKKIREKGEQSESQASHDVPLTTVSTEAGSNQSSSMSGNSGVQTATPSSQQQQSAESPQSAQASGPSPAQTSPPSQSSNYQDLINRLNKPPHIVPYHGATLDRNERLKIIAAIAICESGHDPFSAENLDTEFQKMPSANLSYGHIVHIGLSFGIIQFTQDSGALGKVLVKMRDKDPEKFKEIFGDNSDELITLTTNGIVVPGVNYDSGQAHWNSIRHTSLGQHLTHLALQHNLPVDLEIRGKRVQPIAITVGGARKDLWEGEWKERFKKAGKVDVFQEAELDYAVEGYMNPALPFLRQNNIRSAFGLAFVTACVIRGANKRLLGAAATTMGQPVPFQSGAEEKRALQLIASLSLTQANILGGIPVQRDEIIRAKKLLADETGFLAEDIYDNETYNGSSDH